jgi:hypothetical protein
MKTLAACLFVVVYGALLVWTVEHYKVCKARNCVTVEFLCACLVLGGVGAIVLALLFP